ncbi:MAG: hypothetical protein NT009_00020 [Proteobacteria bacterium]|jgi:hypothetical protein|nr:hypothetical protein [Pseudomonadota bacterium]
MRKEKNIVSPWLGKIIVSVSACLFPRGGAFAIGAEDVDLIPLANKFLRGFEPVTLFGIKFMFFAFNLLPFLFIYKPLPFTWLKREDQNRYIEKWVNSLMYAKRGVITAIKVTCAQFFYSHEEVEKALGYDLPCSAIEK